MENLETQEKVINLGKKLLSELQDSNPNEITAWMTNHLAEKIVEAEKGDDEAKINCIDLILKLWDSRYSLPDGSRPFENFESIFRTLESLNPESVTPRYFVDFYDSKENNQLGESSSLLEMAKQVDHTAKILIKFLFEQAILEATDEKTKEWLNKISGAINSIEFKLIVGNEQEMNDQKQRIQKLEDRISDLTSFESTAKTIRQILKLEVENLKDI